MKLSSPLLFRLTAVLETVKKTTGGSEQGPIRVRAAARPHTTCRRRCLLPLPAPVSSAPSPRVLCCCRSVAETLGILRIYKHTKAESQKAVEAGER
jgi:hypothetical protein